MGAHMMWHRLASQTACPSRVRKAIPGRPHCGSSVSRPKAGRFSGAYSRFAATVKPGMRWLELTEERRIQPERANTLRDRLPQREELDVTIARRGGELWAGRSRLIALELGTTESPALSPTVAVGGLTLVRFRSFLPPALAKALARAFAACSLSSFVTRA